MPISSITNALFPSPSSAATSAVSQQDVQNLINQYYAPYSEAGARALPTLEEQYMMLLNDPAAVNQMLASGFQTSPGYQFQMDQAMMAANQANAAGGMAGTPAHQQQAMGYATGLANQDYYNYLNQMTGLYNTGLSTAGNINQMGYNANAASANLMSDYLAALMGLEYASQASQNRATSSLLGGMLGGIF